MIYKILIFLVLIAEIILCVNVVCWILFVDKYVLSLNRAFIKIRPDIKEVCRLSKVISWQMKELSTNFVENIQREQDVFLYKYASKILTSILLWKINAKLIRRFKRIKMLKFVYKGLTALSNVV